MKEADAILIIVASVFAIGFCFMVLQARQKGKDVRIQPLQPAPGQVPGDEEILALALAGNTIQAIKRCRELHGLGLKEAKDYVERLSAQPPPPRPEHPA